MDYKYKKGQIFGKRLNVPRNIQKQIYGCQLSFEDFIQYGLDDKIPVSCLKEEDRNIVERFGVEKSKTLDWELLEKSTSQTQNFHWFKLDAMAIDPQVEDINLALYELTKNKIPPIQYTEGMRKVYSDRLLENAITDDNNADTFENHFNNGECDLKSIITNWEKVKDKDLSYCLLFDKENKNRIRSDELKQFMNSYSTIFQLISEDVDIYTFIRNVSNLQNEEEKKEFIRTFTDAILERNIEHSSLTNEQYKEIFKFSSIEKYLKKCAESSYYLLDELAGLPKDYIFNIDIPFKEICEKDVLKVIDRFGLKNVVEVDNECNNFFSNNNCTMIKNLSRYNYLENVNTERSIYFDRDGKAIEGPFTKDQFYEAIRKMFLYGSSSAIDYRNITGEFRKRYADIFISDDAPKELQELFYHRELTPELLASHPEYIQYLNGKELALHFKPLNIPVDKKTENVYTFLSSKGDSNSVIKFIVDYHSALDIVSGDVEFSFSNEDNIPELKKKTNEYLKESLIEKRIAYPKNIPQGFIEAYPSLVLSNDAPKELQKAFYERTIDSNFILSNPSYKEYLKQVDLAVIYKGMDVIISNEKIENLVNIIQQTFGKEEGLDLMLEYGEYIEASLAARGYISSEKPNISKEELLQKIDENIYEAIIKRKMKYDDKIPNHFKKSYPTLFLKGDAPKELQNAIYERTIDSNFILSNPSYKEYLRQVDLEVLYDYMECSLVTPTASEAVNLVQLIQQISGKEEAFDLMLEYDKYMKAAGIGKGWYLRVDPNISGDELLQKIDKRIFDAIISGKIKYDDKISSHFKNSYPTLFLDGSVSKDIRDKFYNKELTLEDFNANPNLIEMFGNTNIACGFSEDETWVFSLFSDLNNAQLANYNRLKVISEYSKIQDEISKKTFRKFLIEFGSELDLDKMKGLVEVISRLSLSNSSEIFTFRNQLAIEIMKSDTPMESLNKIEDVFVKNNIPVVGKVYSCFEILYPDLQRLLNKEMTSPVLKASSTMNQKAIIFSDLIKASFGSNNRSVKEYLQNIRVGSELYESIKTGQVQFDMLDESQKKELTTFTKHLATMYNNTMSAKTKNEFFAPTGNVTNDISKLVEKLSPDGTLDYNVGDRVVRMFCGFAGVNTLEQAEEYINKKIKVADSRNRSVSSSDMILNKGDFIKGIGDITYLRNILQNGSVSKEYLGDSAGSDYTPLDTDVSMIMSSDGTISDKKEDTAASEYGPIWFVLKNDERFVTTRVKGENLELKKDTSKLEAFYTGVIGDDHYGIRTGFASSEINYILMEKYDPRVGNEIAMNGFYIPIANLEGKIIFTPNDYDKIRQKMSGLSYFGEENYTFSPNLVTNDTNELVGKLDQSNYEVQVKRNKINEVIRKSLNEVGLNFKTSIDGDLTPGVVEFIDTGSTGRGTNKPGDGDFDFMMRLDKSTFLNDSELDKLKQTILKNLGKIGSKKITDSGDFRLKKVQLDDETIVDIDITFVEKTDKVAYSTDMALQDRLETIRKNDPEKYKYVIANIILAKQILGAAEAYKPNRGDVPQGGLGGVGVENWILQNGGSFADAAKDFVRAAEGEIFSRFSSSYQIWDFGDNHLASKRGKYEHDNFVANNMSEEGYQKMRRALKEYLKYMETDLNQVESITR